MRRYFMAGLLAWLGLAAPSLAATIYVSTTGTNDAANRYDTWEGAATSINAAVAIATDGELVLVTNGIYAVETNLVVTNFTIQSVNGPEVTTVYRPAAAGTLFPIFRVNHANSLVAGFSITNGFWTLDNDRGGSIHLTAGTVSNCWIVNTPYIGGTQSGAAWMNGGLMTACVLSNCVPRTYALRMYGGTVEDCTITKNYNPYDSDAPIDVYGGTMRRCRIYGNSAGGSGSGAMRLTAGRVENCLICANKTTSSSQAGGVELAGGVLAHCTIAANTNAAGSTGAGVERGSGAMTNCIVYGNAGSGVDYSGSAGAAWYSCAPQLTHGSQGNITNNPQFKAMAGGDFTLVRGSPCMDTGTTIADITSDLDRAIRPQDGDGAGGAVSDMGCYEVRDPSTGPLEVSFSGAPLYGFEPLDVVFTASTLGSNQTITWYGWDFDNDGNWDTNGANLAIVTNSYTSGTFSVRLWVTNSIDEMAASTNLNYVKAVKEFIYVATNGGHNPPFSTWADAATNINVAVAYATNGGQKVMVSNGVYAVTNTLVVTSFTIQSVNGPDYTTIYKPFYPSNIIFVVSNDNAWVSGFKLTNAQMNIYGCGQCLELHAGTVSNCVIADCPGWSSLQAGVVKINAGLMTRCVISNNQSRSHVIAVRGGVLQDSVLYNNRTYYDPAPLCVGGAGIVRRCQILNNIAEQGSAAYVVAMDGSWSSAGGTLENCLVWGNKSLNGPIIGMGGGSRILNCTVASNIANSARYAMEYLSGTIGITNCIVYGNSGVGQVNNATIPKYSCASELTTGVNGNRSDDPKFVNMVGVNCRLDFGSPCVNAGTNIGVAVDILGTNRDDQCDMGAYERIAVTSGPLQVAFSGSPIAGIGLVTSVFTAVVDGSNTNIAWWGWDFNNDGIFEQSGAGLRITTNTFGGGRHTIILRATNTTPETAAATNANYITVQSAGNDVYVATNGTGTFPYDAWAKATTSLYDAVYNAAHAGSTVWVSNGAYEVSSRLTLATNKAVQGVGGPEGITVYRSSAGYFPIFELTHSNALVAGLTLTNGAGTGSGGALQMTAGTASNCVMTRCVVGAYPDGVMSMSGGLVTRCIISNNAPRSVTALITGGVMEDCVITKTTAGHDLAPLTIGFGIAGGTARRCKIINNTPPGNIAGGVQIHCRGRLENSLVCGNKAAASSYGAVLIGGGVAETVGGAMVNCTVASNSTVSGAGGVTMNSGGVITNCIIYGNDAAFPNYVGAVSAAWYSCAFELTNNFQGNITNNPLFNMPTNGDFRPTKYSPCINAGNNASWTADDRDLDGNMRISSGTADMGAYELILPPGAIFVWR